MKNEIELLDKLVQLKAKYKEYEKAMDERGFEFKVNFNLEDQMRLHGYHIYIETQLLNWILQVGLIVDEDEDK